IGLRSCDFVVCFALKQSEQNHQTTRTRNHETTPKALVINQVKITEASRFYTRAISWPLSPSTESTHRRELCGSPYTLPDHLQPFSRPPHQRRPLPQPEVDCLARRRA